MDSERASAPSLERATGKVLVGGADEESRRPIVRALERAGFLAREVAGSEEVLAHAPYDFDLVLLDAELEDELGADTCARLKADARCRAVPVLLISTQGELAEITRTDPADERFDGADGLLVRPVKPLEIVASVRALLRTRRVEAALRESEETHRLIVEATTDGIWDWDLRQGRLRLSDRLVEMIGAAGEAALALRRPSFEAFCELVHPDDREGFRDLLRRHFEGRAPFRIEFRLLHASGRYRACASRGKAERDGRGRVVRMVASVSDVTDMRAAEEERLRLLERERQARALAESSERQYRFLADAVPQMVFASRADGRIDYCNQRWLDYTGLPLEVGSDFGWEAVVHPEDLPQVRARWSRSIGTGEPFELEFRKRRGFDGAYRWHLTRANPLRDDEGRILRWFGTSTDIDDQRRVAEAQRLLAEAGAVLASSLDYLATLAGVAELAVRRVADWCAIDLVQPGGALRRIAVAHSAPERQALAEELTRRYPARASDAHGPGAVLRTGRPELVRHVTAEHLEKTARDAGEFELLAALGLRSSLCVPLQTRQGPIGVLWLAVAESGRRFDGQDLAVAEELATRASMAIENARLFELAERERERAEGASRLKDEFLATVSHELRTPLTAILGWSRMLRSGALAAEKWERALETVERNASAQAALIEDLLDISRIVTGKLRLNVLRTSPARAIELAASSVQPAADAKGVRVEVEIPAEAGEAGPGIFVLADPDRLQQIVWNLLSNAVKFTPPGGRVAVRLRTDGDAAELSVSDTGQGIAPAFLPHVFDRFRQADGKISRSHGGLGLGLAIVRHLVEQHGGTIAARSEGQGRGAVFSVRLPLATGDAALAPAPSSGAPSGEPPSERARGMSDVARGLSVVVVDDEPDTRDLVASILELSGARVVTAKNAAEGFEALRAVRPDVLVSDIGLPGDTGYALARRVRALSAGEGGATPALALTAYARESDRAEALASGFNAHLAKPVEPAELVALVAHLAGRVVPLSSSPLPSA